MASRRNAASRWGGGKEAEDADGGERAGVRQQVLEFQQHPALIQGSSSSRGVPSHVVDEAADVATAARLSTRFAPQPLEWKVREDGVLTGVRSRARLAWRGVTDATAMTRAHGRRQSGGSGVTRRSKSSSGGSGGCALPRWDPQVPSTVVASCLCAYPKIQHETQ
uniref:Uncharacterized protein n=1 Tax=Oryza rufipogon TaxID=4529 RepID=A0A0E0R675_ORYRU